MKMIRRKDRVFVRSVTISYDETLEGEEILPYVGEVGTVIAISHVGGESYFLVEFDDGESFWFKDGELEPSEDHKPIATKESVIEHLEYLEEEYEERIIPAQTESDARELLKEDKFFLQEAIKYLEEG